MRPALASGNWLPSYGDTQGPWPGSVVESQLHLRDAAALPFPDGGKPYQGNSCRRNFGKVFLWQFFQRLVFDFGAKTLLPWSGSAPEAATSGQPCPGGHGGPARGPQTAPVLTAVFLSDDTELAKATAGTC